MKIILPLFVMLLFISCSKPSDTTAVEDSTAVVDDPQAELVDADETKQQDQQLRLLIADFEASKDKYPSIGFTQDNPGTDLQVTYLVEEGQAIWMQKEEVSKVGGEFETYLMNRDPEGTFYIHYGNKTEGQFGYSAMTSEEWYSVQVNDEFEPYITGSTNEKKFDWQADFQAITKFVNDNRDNFVLKDGWYTYDDAASEAPRHYKFSESLMESGLFAAK